jgi:hypothetical protein
MSRAKRALESTGPTRESARRSGGVFLTVFDGFELDGHGVHHIAPRVALHRVGN